MKYSYLKKKEDADHCETYLTQSMCLWSQKCHHIFFYLFLMTILHSVKRKNLLPNTVRHICEPCITMCDCWKALTVTSLGGEQSKYGVLLYFFKRDLPYTQKNIRHQVHHWFRWWLGAVRQQAITCTSVDQNLHIYHMASLGHICHMESLGPNELNVMKSMRIWNDYRQSNLFI